MDAKDVRRIGLLLLAAVAFGVGTSVLKGNGDGLRAAIGNMSAPWLVLPFVVGAVAGRGRVLVGSILGLVLSLVALAGFYGANTFVLQLGPHPWLVDLRLTFEGGQRFFLLALFSGPVIGALGAWWAKTRSIALPMGVALLFMLEPVAELATRSSGSAVVWASEALAGLVAALLIARFVPKALAA